MNDQELNRLLKEWKAPGAPLSLEGKVLPRKASPKRAPLAWLWSGSIRIPVPVALVAALALAVWWYVARPQDTPAPPPAKASGSVSLAEFEPVKEMKVRVLPVGGDQ